MAWLKPPELFSSKCPQGMSARFVSSVVASHWPLKGSTPLFRSSVDTETRSSSPFLALSRNHSRMSRMSTALNNAAEPVERTASPYSDPLQIGPKSKILASRTSNYHSTSLRNMVTVNTVNKTALHPGGVQYVQSDGAFSTRRPETSLARPTLTALLGLSRSTPSSRRNYTRRHTSTMTV